MSEVCRCACAYVGAQAIGEPIRCERCRGLVDDIAAARMDAVHAESLRRLEEWAAANPMPPPGRPVERTRGHEEDERE